MEKQDYFTVPVVVKKDESLNSREKLVLMLLYSYVDHPDNRVMLSFDKLTDVSALNQDVLKDILKKLKNYGWLKIEEINTNEFCCLVKSKLTKQSERNLYNGSGSEVARAWPKYFGTSQLTPHTLRRIRAFIEEGIEEQVIIEVMKMSVKNASGNPVNYTMSILNDYIDRGIYTMEDLKEEKQRVKEYGKQIQGNNRAEKKRTPREELEELYRQGYK